MAKDDHRGIPHNKGVAHEKGTVGKNTLADDAPSPVAGAHIDRWDIVPGTHIDKVHVDLVPGTQAEPQAVDSEKFELPADGEDKDGWEQRIPGHDFVDDRTQKGDGSSDPVSAKNDARADKGDEG